MCALGFGGIVRIGRFNGNLVDVEIQPWRGFLQPVAEHSSDHRVNVGLTGKLATGNIGDGVSGGARGSDRCSGRLCAAGRRRRLHDVRALCLGELARLKHDLQRKVLYGFIPHMPDVLNVLSVGPRSIAFRSK